jgi:hypothetical protein
MKMKTILAGALVALACTACSSKDKKSNEAAVQPPTAQEKAVSQMGTDRDSYVSATQARIDGLNNFGRELRQKAQTSDSVQRKKLSNAAEDIGSILNDARRELADVKNAAPENWVDEKRDVEKAMNLAESQYSNSVYLMR